MKKVLVVDDETSCLMLYKIYLNREGINALCVDSPRTALELLTHETFDAIISDMCMPEMNGVEFLQSLRKQKLHQGPFIFVTGHIDEEGQALGGKHYPGVSGVFGKPCPFSEVAALIEGELQDNDEQAPAAAMSRLKPTAKPSVVTEKRVSSGISETRPNSMSGKTSAKVSSSALNSTSSATSNIAPNFASNNAQNNASSINHIASNTSHKAPSCPPSIAPQKIAPQKERTHERAS